MAEENQNVESVETTTAPEQTPETTPEVTPDNQEPETTVETQEETVTEPITDETQATEMLQEKGFDYEKLQSEYDQFGDITEDTRKELEKQGITKELLDNYIEGRKAIVAQQMADIADSIGGQEQFETVVNWAKANLPIEEKRAIDAVHDPTIIKGLLRDLKNRMEQTDGKTPQQLSGSGGSSAMNGYRSQAEMFEAIKNPKYKKDEAYRLDVQKKIQASREAGIDLGL